MNFKIKRVKIFVTTPKENLTKIRDAVCKAGAGIIGEYSYCTFTSDGVGTFMPSSKANPYIGKANILELAQECKVEFLCEIEKVKDVIAAIREIHPYEEPAIDIVPLLDECDF